MLILSGAKLQPFYVNNRKLMNFKALCSDELYIYSSSSLTLKSTSLKTIPFLQIWVGFDALKRLVFQVFNILMIKFLVHLHEN